MIAPFEETVGLCPTSSGHEYRPPHIWNQGTMAISIASSTSQTVLERVYIKEVSHI